LGQADPSDKGGEDRVDAHEQAEGLGRDAPQREHVGEQRHRRGEQAGDDGAADRLGRHGVTQDDHDTDRQERQR
jgi:hypothetical protein